MMMMNRVMCVLAVVLCFACGYTMTAAAVETASRVSTVVEVDCTNMDNPHIRRNDMSEERPCVTEKDGEECKKYIALCNFRQQDVASNRNDNTDRLNQDTENDGKGAENQRPNGSADVDTILPVTPGDQEASNSNGGNSTPVNSNPNQEPPAAESSTTNENTANQQSPPAAEDATTPSAPQENSNSDSTTTTPSSPENTTTEAPSTTPTPSTDAEISTIAPTEQNSANADSSFSPVWIRTAAPLLIVAALVL
ncbi:uncharacterized protein TM35_001371020 [Trypanosoma theileri]|uniref:Mucin-associated surface protein (MASP) n=1 Tax=Trypanosoma theileri TaxID=67003 RepID=A0A1X0NDI4_9TRYP|nr:uncharacterized protein TM35_001371020 [Trypanosoma theileri]ORC80951.1 hypothetical protein TM35_001371020 [Trypanosoma theileri]